MWHPGRSPAFALRALLAGGLGANLSLAALVLLATLFASPVIAQAPAMRPEITITVGPTYAPTPGPTPGPPTGAAIATNVPGNFVIARSGGGNVLAHRLTSGGTLLGPPIQVNTNPAYPQSNPAMASDAPGNSMVLWEGQDGDGRGIFARRVDLLLNLQGPEFQVNTATAGDQREPSLAMNGPGDSVAVWSSIGQGASSVGQDGSEGGIYGQRYDASGNPLGGEFLVNTYTTGNQDQPDGAMDPAGGFVLLWRSTGQSGASGEIMGQRYGPDGVPQGPEFQANTYTPGDQAGPRVVSGTAGQFVAAWESGDGQDGSGKGVVARWFDVSASPLGPEVLINTYTTGDQHSPALASNPSGDVIFTWNSLGQDGAGDGVYAQRFNASGRRVGEEFAINTYTTGNQQRPDVALDGSRQFLEVWESERQGASGPDVLARGSGFPDGQPMSVDTRASSASSNINGVLEAGETVNVDPSWRNNSFISTNFLGAASNFTGPPGPLYTITAGFAGYGTIAPGVTSNCFDAAANCYELAVSGTRPASHWDATFNETLLVFPPIMKTWTLHIGESFPDVPVSNQFYPFVENLFHNGITAGGACGGYCPGDPAIRQQMAVFALKAKEGSAFTPPACAGTFTDVPVSNPFCRWIEELARRGVVAGCGNGNYCPNNPVTRQQMAVFMLRTLEGSAYTPPPCTGVFNDVPASSPFCPYIEQMYQRGYVAGCGNGNYCPAAPTTRAQMSAFIIKTLAVALFGP